MITNYEQEYVINAYNKIAHNFDITRTYIWPCIKAFIDTLNKECFILDVGCGNGKTVKYFKNNGFNKVKGCDICPEFVKICNNKLLDVVEANILKLPFEDNTFDFVISTAVIHHLSKENDRIKSIGELLRITKPNGIVLISVASYENQFYKIKYLEQDTIIPWKNSKGNHIADRYYYLFKENELEKLCEIYSDIIFEIKRIKSLYNWSISIIKK